jgi:hypothetical protein
VASGTIYRGGLFLPWLMLNRDSTLAPATPTPITSTTPAGWAVCCRCGWTFCESRGRRRHSPERWPPRIRQTFLVLPEIAEPLGRKFAISNRMLDVLVAEIVLQRPRIHTLIGQLEPS